LPADATSVREARAAATEFARVHCNAGERLLSDIALCVSEAAGNVVTHAYPEDGGEISLTIRRTAGELVIEVADQGTAVSAGGDSPPLGVGLRIVQALSDATVEHADGCGRRVTMRFPCDSASYVPRS
jgi:anti-sigma regulatory factor (Ser/Thr protein kinase)